LGYEALYETISGGTLPAYFNNVKLTGTAMLLFTRRGLTRGGSTSMLATGTSPMIELEVLDLKESGASSYSFGLTLMMAAEKVGGFMMI
jgi:hypothetical protein